MMSTKAQILKHFQNVNPDFYQQVLNLPSHCFKLPYLKTESAMKLGLYRSITAQQLSNRAAAKIWQRVLALCPLDQASEQDLRQAGLSFNKVQTFKGIADLKLKVLKHLPESQIRDILTSYKGIGNWTVDMCLIFVFGFEDVFSINDLGLRKAAANFYKLNHQTDADIIVQKVKQFSPYQSYVSLAFWQLYDQI